MLHFKLLQYFVDRDYIRAGIRMMDVGTQNLLFVEEPAAVALVSRLRLDPLAGTDLSRVGRLCSFSTPRPGERTTFLHELLALTDVTYESVDVVDGGKTTLFDLNHDTAPRAWRAAFDFVINCGTLEHVIDQFRALTFIHDVLRVGGIWFDQPPSVGFHNHGYFNYNPLFYVDLAAANRFEMIEAWYSHAGTYPEIDSRFPVIDVNRLDEASERARAGVPFRRSDGKPAAPATSFNFNVAMRKIVDAPLRLPLEVRTTHGPVGDGARETYGRAVFDLESPR